ncbi:MAG: MJ1255/VC2487 family glycosyltransferase [Myxococcota bacterium]
MRLLYGVVGEGMGHATRSRVILEHLLASGHEVRVVVSGRAHGFLTQRFAGRAGISFEEIHGLHLTISDNELDKSASLWSNLEEVPQGLAKNVEVFRKVVGEQTPDAVVSDFESWAYVFGRLHDLPVVSIDNMQVINRCAHEPDLLVDDGLKLPFRLSKLAVKAKLPGAYHYLVTSFFFPKVRKPRTTLVPPILRPEILKATRRPGAHVLVYQTASTNTGLVPMLQRMSDHRFRVYGMGREGHEGNVTLCPFSETTFIEDLATARAVIAGGGYSLMGEAVHLGVPMLSVPIRGQFEQTLNARYLDRLGYGHYAEELEADRLAAFLAQQDELAHNLSRFPRQRDNGMTFACLDELLQDIALDEPRPARLQTPAMGAFEE